jgi:hypothetical protein
MKPNTIFRCQISGWVTSALLLAGGVQAAPPTWLPPAEVPEGTVLLQIEELKATYLQCDSLSAKTFLDSSTAAQCSTVSERLRRIGFDGRGDAVLAWWKAMADERRGRASPSAPVLTSSAARL